MMGALADIQRRGEVMVESVERQRLVLQQLELEAEQAERSRETAEREAAALQERIVTDV